MFERVRTLPCPDCGEIVSERAARCRFCGAAIDPAAARAAAAAQGRVNEACSDASYMRIVALSMWGALAVMTGVTSVLLNSGFLALSVVLPVLIVRWQLKFGRVETRDPDFARARRAKNLSLALWLAALAAAFFLAPLVPAGVPELFLTR